MSLIIKYNIIHSNRSILNLTTDLSHYGGVRLCLDFRSDIGWTSVTDALDYVLSKWRFFQIDHIAIWCNSLHNDKTVELEANLSKRSGDRGLRWPIILYCWHDCRLNRPATLRHAPPRAAWRQDNAKLRPITGSYINQYRIIRFPPFIAYHW